MSWPLLKPREKSEDEDYDFNVLRIHDESTEESTDEEDNRLRKEYDMNRTRIPKRQQFEFVKLLKINLSM